MRRVIVIAMSFLLAILTFAGTAGAQELSKYTVRSGDTMWKIANGNSVTLTALKKVNGNHNNNIYVGEVLKLPYKVTEADKVLMAKLVRAEASGESYAGKVAVATVILNRVDSTEFPNNVHDVIYETYDGKYYAFSPVQNGEINKAYDSVSMQAVNEAVRYRGTGAGSLFFYNPKTSTSKWITSRPVTVVIGNHTFAK